MKKPRFTETQIPGILKENAFSLSLFRHLRQHGININTLYNWKNKFSGMDVSEMKKTIS